MSQITTKSAKRTIQSLLEGEQFREQVSKALPRHLTPERFIRVAITAMTKTPDLAQCTPESFFNCLLSLSQFGLEPDGRRAHLIPFRDNKNNTFVCTLIIDWKGLAELAMRSGFVSNLHADVVRDGDVFEYNAGKLKSHIPHFLRRDRDKPADAGEVYAVYAVAEFKDGTSKADVMSLDEVKAIRARSKSGKFGPWVTDFNEMAKKTVFRRLSKWLPLSAEFRDAISIEDGDSDDHSPKVEKPVFDTVAPTFLGAGSAPATAPAEEQTDETNPLVTVRALCKSEGIAEGDVLSYLHQQDLGSGAATLDAVDTTELSMVADAWDTVLIALKGDTTA